VRRAICGTVRGTVGDWDRVGSPPTVRSASAMLVTTRVPKAELEEPSFGALVRERLAERGTRSETQDPTAGSFASAGGEGRAGFPGRSRRRGAPWFRPTFRRPDAWRARGSAGLLQGYGMSSPVIKSDFTSCICPLDVRWSEDCPRQPSYHGRPLEVHDVKGGRVPGGRDSR
jgi:hypothetical protein